MAHSLGNFDLQHIALNSYGVPMVLLPTKTYENALLNQLNFHSQSMLDTRVSKVLTNEELERTLRV